MMQKNPLEWTVFGTSLLLIALCLGVLGYEHWTRSGSPPFITARIGEVLERPGSFAMEILVQNSGDRTAAGVHVQLLLEETDEQAEAVLDHVPYRSTRRAWLSTRADPRQHHAQVRVLGYEEP